MCCGISGACQHALSLSHSTLMLVNLPSPIECAVAMLSAVLVINIPHHILCPLPYLDKYHSTSSVHCHTLISTTAHPLSIAMPCPPSSLSQTLPLPLPPLSKGLTSPFPSHYCMYIHTCGSHSRKRTLV